MDGRLRIHRLHIQYIYPSVRSSIIPPSIISSSVRQFIHPPASLSVCLSAFLSLFLNFQHFSRPFLPAPIPTLPLMRSPTTAFPPRYNCRSLQTPPSVSPRAPALRGAFIRRPLPPSSFMQIIRLWNSVTVYRLSTDASRPSNVTCNHNQQAAPNVSFVGLERL